MEAGCNAPEDILEKVIGPLNVSAVVLAWSDVAVLLLVRLVVLLNTLPPSLLFVVAPFFVIVTVPL